MCALFLTRILAVQYQEFVEFLSVSLVLSKVNLVVRKNVMPNH